MNGKRELDIGNNEPFNNMLPYYNSTAVAVVTKYDGDDELCFSSYSSFVYPSYLGATA